MIDGTPPEPDEKHLVGINVQFDSVRLLKSETNVKCLIVVDVTNLNDDNRQEFAKRAMTALMRMADKLPVKGS